ncbi:hypothetical protein MTO96_038406, partial [Rhipicephalus appendiculatus]
MAAGTAPSRITLAVAVFLVAVSRLSVGATP